MMRVNKFNIHWQIVRCEAKMMANPEDKIQHILRFLDKNPCIQNYYRVLNWFQMTKIAYDKLTRGIFDFYLKQMHVHHYKKQVAGKHAAFGLEDMDNSFDGIHTSELRMVLRDLQKRTYGFQFAGRVPQQHIEFVERLEQEIELRKTGGEWW